MTGTIRCNSCAVAMNDRTGSCPKCGRAQCHIVLHWQGTTRRLFKDVRGVGFGYMTAYDQLFAMNREIRQRAFSISDWQSAKVKERRLDQQLDKWLDQVKTEVDQNELSFGTYHSYRSYVQNHISPKIGHLDIREIRYADLEAFKDSLPRSLKIRTKRTIVNILHTAMTWTWRKGIIEAMPPFPVVKGNDAAPKIALTMVDQAAALALIPVEHRDVFEFETETGLRPGETCALKIKDIDFNTCTMTVQRTFTMRHLRESDKEGHKKAVPLSRRAMDLARAHAAGRFPDDWLFINPATGSHYAVQRLGLYWKKYTNLPCSHYEGTRHSFCTQIVEVADRSAAQDLMRHADGRSTDLYIHNRTEYLRDVIEKRGNVSEMKKKRKT